ncbi:phage baseplate assembly protein V [Rheinheimera sp.]|uniref:phage baseplate assembly protein V n=1 Tax=Rheinheimera sp. TaxID=1869214 RepID=UPI00307E74E9
MNKQYSFEMAEITRRLAGLIRFCQVSEVGTEENQGKVKVTDGQLASTWLSTLQGDAAENIDWRPLDVGAYVVVLCPSGDFAQGVIIGSLYQSAFAPPSTSLEVTARRYKDGSVFSYDREASKLHIAIAKDGTILIEVSGGATINGPVTINGEVKINGKTEIVGATSVDGTVSATQNISSDADVKAGSVSLKSHVHLGVTPGDKKTLQPE